MINCRTGIWLLCIVMLGCKPEQEAVITCKVERKDFSERIIGTGTLRSANNVVITVPRISSSSIKVIELAEEGTIVNPGDTVCILEATDIRKYYDKYVEDVDKSKAELIKQEAMNAETLAQLHAQLEEFKVKQRLSYADSIQMKFTPPVKSEIQKLEEKINIVQQNKILRKLEAQQNINEQSAGALRSQIKQKERVLKHYNDQLEQLTITAPQHGMVVYSVSKRYVIMDGYGVSSTGGGKISLGSTARINMPLIVLPDLDSMQVVLMLQEAEYKRIQTGQKVIIQPESLPDLEIAGTVKSKSLASQPLAYRFKVKSYKIIIDIDSLDNILLPGLSANCEIIVQHENDTVVAPSIAIFEADSIKFVYLEENGLFSKQTVETGRSNPTETIIAKGLQGNETIALLKPPFNLIRKKDETRNE